MGRKKQLSVGAAVTTATVLVAGIAYASIPNDGVISACYAKNGALRVIDTSTTSCKSNETLLSWNQQGAPGADGTDGVDGVDGTDGRDGVDGTDGRDGVDGVDGTDGRDGVSGYTTQHEQFVVPPGSSMMREVLCPSGTRPLGGGGHAGNVFNDKGLANVSNAYIAESDINDARNGWAVTAVNRFSQPALFSVDVICAAV